MKILIDNSQYQYISIPQNILQDDRLRLRDLGLLIIVLSLPNNEIINKNELNYSLPNESYHTIEKSLKRLESLGYLHRVQVRDGSGKFMCYKWTISTAPQSQPINSETPNN